MYYLSNHVWLRGTDPAGRATHSLRSFISAPIPATPYSQTLWAIIFGQIRLMHWDEKIDKIKRETDPDDFKVPFTDWSTILKKIEEKFIVKENSNYVFSNWADRLKDKRKIKQLQAVDLEAEITKLTPDQNYWIVLTGDNSAAKNLVYDSKPDVILKLLQLREGDFYIGDKKYSWLTYFKYKQADVEVCERCKALAKTTGVRGK